MTKYLVLSYGVICALLQLVMPSSLSAQDCRSIIEKNHGRVPVDQTPNERLFSALQVFLRQEIANDVVTFHRGVSSDESDIKFALLVSGRKFPVRPGQYGQLATYFDKEGRVRVGFVVAEGGRYLVFKAEIKVIMMNLDEDSRLMRMEENRVLFQNSFTTYTPNPGWFIFHPTSMADLESFIRSVQDDIFVREYFLLDEEFDSPTTTEVFVYKKQHGTTTIVRDGI